MATIAVGDIHGNVRALDDLLATIMRECGVGDIVVFLGDYIDRGSQSKRCLDSILNFIASSKASVVSLMGSRDR